MTLNNKKCTIVFLRHLYYNITLNSAYSVLAGKPEEKRPLGRPRHRWEDNIKVELQEVG
jgi:hypothetical protein